MCVCVCLGGGGECEGLTGLEFCKECWIDGVTTG